MRLIAKNLSRPPSTISREISRNGGINKYRAVEADKQTWIRAKRPKNGAGKA
nr:helix-turn-helix domain-containing protein [Legionella massiliensis]